jgi:tRNA threonylcarbamoyladenosine biosynthesis protein TsaE
MMKTKTLVGEFVTGSARETIRLGRKLGAAIDTPLAILLYGDLGTGKTTLSKGLALGLGVKNANDVNSPTFVLVNEYRGRFKIYHVDLYRLDTLSDLESIGLDEILQSQAIVIIEWGEKLARLPESALRIRISDLGDDKRKIEIKYCNSIG